MSINKSELARRLRARGIGIAAICRDLEMTVTNVRKAIERKSPEDTRALQKAATRSLKAKPRAPQKHLHTHQVIEPFKAKPAPQGYCMAWIVENGRARRCGKLCKRQLCDECSHTTLPIAAPRGRRDYA